MIINKLLTDISTSILCTCCYILPCKAASWDHQDGRLHKQRPSLNHWHEDGTYAARSKETVRDAVIRQLRGGDTFSIRVQWPIGQVRFVLRNYQCKHTYHFHTINPLPVLWSN